MNNGPADIDRRQFLKIAAGTAGAAMLAGCGGGSDISPTPGYDDGIGTSTRTRTRTTTGSGPATGNPCDDLVGAGYQRYNGAEKPIPFTFEYPVGWEVVAETAISTAFAVVLDREVLVGDETYSYAAHVQVGREPIDDPDLDSYADSGWINFEFDFGGAPARFVLSPRGTADPSRIAFGYLPHDGPDGRTLHSVTIAVLSDDDQECKQTVGEVIERIITSIVPNEAGTFEPVTE